MATNPAAGAAGDRLAQLMRMADAEPGDPFFPYGIAQEHARAGRHDEAIAWYDRTVSVDASYCYAYFHKARSLEELGRVDDACAALRTGIERARAAGDRHALSELSGYLDQLS
jgi:tetratricopeptide (TPR) repeat protein